MVYIILIIIAILIITCITIYNKLVKYRNKVDNSLSQIDIQLQRRFDLIPNFVETVKGYMTHETETFTKITQLRTSLNNTQNINEKIELNEELSSTLKTIIAVSENYPDLKSNQTFIQLTEELSNTENKISFSRQFYNDAVTIYNTEIQLFPSNIVARIFGFSKRELFKVDSNEVRQNVKVDLNK